MLTKPLNTPHVDTVLRGIPASGPTIPLKWQHEMPLPTLHNRPSTTWQYPGERGEPFVSWFAQQSCIG
jgi:hypothetical protein